MRMNEKGDVRRIPLDRRKERERRMFANKMGSPSLPRSLFPGLLLLLLLSWLPGHIAHANDMSCNVCLSVTHVSNAESWSTGRA